MATQPTWSTHARGCPHQRQLGGCLLVDVVDIPGLHIFDPAPALAGREEAIVTGRRDEGPTLCGARMTKPRMAAADRSGSLFSPCTPRHRPPWVDGAPERRSDGSPSPSQVV